MLHNIRRRDAAHDREGKDMRLFHIKAKVKEWRAFDLFPFSLFTPLQQTTLETTIVFLPVFLGE